MDALEVLGFVVALGAFALMAWLVGRAYLRLRGKRLVTCPETNEPAAVDLDLRFAAVTSAFGRPHFRLKDCSRWPERQSCGQVCLMQLEAAPHDCLVRNIVGSWYKGKACAYCGKAFGEIHWHDHEPAVLSPGGLTLQWSEVLPERLPLVLVTHRPVCWDCHVAERFRREHPDLAIERRRPAPHPEAPASHKRPAA